MSRAGAIYYLFRPMRSATVGGFGASGRASPALAPPAPFSRAAMAAFSFMYWSNSSMSSGFSSMRVGFRRSMARARVGRSTENDRTLQIVSADGFSTLKCTKCLDNGRMELQTYKDFIMRAATKEERDEW